jgi:hypothetical protein
VAFLSLISEHSQLTRSRLTIRLYKTFSALAAVDDFSDFLGSCQIYEQHRLMLVSGKCWMEDVIAEILLFFPLFLCPQIEQQPVLSLYPPRNSKVYTIASLLHMRISNR